jgi:hypothetical protein
VRLRAGAGLRFRTRLTARIHNGNPLRSELCDNAYPISNHCSGSCRWQVFVQIDFNPDLILPLQQGCLVDAGLQDP